MKLDKSFLDAIDTVEADVAIVQAVITMGHALGMKITAEGVERVEQADRLRELGCDSAMGWLWSPAVSPEQLARVRGERLLDESARVGSSSPCEPRGLARSR